jgi:hypothetical protein
MIVNMTIIFMTILEQHHMKISPTGPTGPTGAIGVTGHTGPTGIITPDEPIVKEYCKRGTRKNKDGNCEPNLPEQNKTHQNIDALVVKKRGTRKNKDGNREPIMVNQKLTIQNDSKTTDDYDYDDASFSNNKNNNEIVNFKYTESNNDFDLKIENEVNNKLKNKEDNIKKEIDDYKEKLNSLTIQIEKDIISVLLFESLVHYRLNQTANVYSIDEIIE